MEFLLAIWLGAVVSAGGMFGVDAQLSHAEKIRQGLEPPILVLSVPETDWRYKNSVEKRKAYFLTHEKVDGNWVEK